MLTLPNYQTFRSTQRFGSLDGLRAISIVAVLWHHSGGPAAFEFLKRGQLGVHLFFAISGLLITTLLVREREKHGRISIRDFFIRRSLRIFPLYYAVLAVYVLAVVLKEKGTEAGREFFSNLPFFLSYTSNWFVNHEDGVRTIFYFSWSLATEEQFYMVFPWLVALLSLRATSIVLVATLAVVYLTHSNGLLFVIPEGSLSRRIIWNIAPCITLGALAALMIHTRRGFAVVSSILGHRVSFPLALAALAVVVSIPRGGMLQEYIVFGVLVALVVSAMIREDHMLADVLRAKWIIRIGVISYGMYLMHMLSFNVADLFWQSTGLPKWAGRMTLGVVITVVVAEISYRTFESWFLRQRGRFSRA
jgi:peptidoglycan/LPS O-acetylase OafA/YrhL